MKPKNVLIQIRVTKLSTIELINIFRMQKILFQTITQNYHYQTIKKFIQYPKIVNLITSKVVNTVAQQLLLIQQIVKYYTKGYYYEKI